MVITRNPAIPPERSSDFRLNDRKAIREEIKTAKISLNCGDVSIFSVKENLLMRKLEDSVPLGESS